MLLVVIAGCEIAFWVLLAVGMLVRYGLRLRWASNVLLACLPLVDLVLLVVTIVHLSGGATATTADALAAIYIGVSVAGGKQMIGWADRQVAYRFAGGPKPRRPAKYGPEHARRERVGWYRHALAWAVGCALLLVACLVVGSWHRTTALTGTAALWTLVLAIDFLISFSYTLWPRPMKSDRPSAASERRPARSRDI